MSNSADVEQLVKGFRDPIPPKESQGIPFIDVDTVLRRHPEVCLIDGLAYDNPLGSRFPKRWQDVEALLAAGISVITSVNLQFIEEKQLQVEAIRGKKVKESVPEAFIRIADEIELVDAALRILCDPVTGFADRNSWTRLNTSTSCLNFGRSRWS